MPQTELGNLSSMWPLCLTALCLLIASAPAIADSKLDSDAVARLPAVFTKQFKVQSGSALKLTDISSDPTADCAISAVGPTIRIVQLPTHGTIIVQSSLKALSYPTPNPLSACNGKTAPAISVVYRADSGFKGVDAFAIGFEAPEQVTKFAYQATVE